MREWSSRQSPLLFHSIPNMSPKRAIAEAEHDNSETKAKRFNKGFSVGPANLPDGTHLRKGNFCARRTIQNPRD